MCNAGWGSVVERDEARQTYASSPTGFGDSAVYLISFCLCTPLYCGSITLSMYLSSHPLVQIVG